MPHNFFLTGPKRCGKSTLLQKYVGPYRKLWGGYFVQRVVSGDGGSFAFRLVDLASQEDYSLEVERASLTGMVNQIVLNEKEKGVKAFPATFETAGTDILRAALYYGGTPVLMDELGRFEQEAPSFMKAVSEVLDAQAPVLGVIKKEHNPFLDSVRNRPDIELVDWEKYSYEEIDRKLRRFLLDAGQSVSLKNGHVWPYREK